MGDNTTTSEGNPRLALLLCMAMFVLVVDTSIMNVSISAVVHDLDTDVSSVQSAIALEALVSAAFILIGSKVGDLIGRKRAYVLGLLGYAVGAIGMTLAQSLAADHRVLGAHRRDRRVAAPSRDAVAHPRQLRGQGADPGLRTVGAAAAIAAAVGPLLGGFITTYLSWRVAFLLEAVVIAVVLSGISLVRDVPYTGDRGVDVVGRDPLDRRHGRPGARHPRLAGGRRVGRRAHRGRTGRAGQPRRGGWSGGSATASTPLLDPDLFRSKLFRLGVTGQMSQQIALGGTMIVLPIFLQMVLEYDAMQAGLSIAPLSLSMFAVAMLVGQAGRARRPAAIIRAGFALLALGIAVLIPIVPRRRLRVVPARSRCSSPAPGSGLLVSQLNNYTLSPITEERVSEAAGVNSAAGSFGLSFGLAFAGAIMLATLSFVVHRHGASRARC